MNKIGTKDRKFKVLREEVREGKKIFIIKIARNLFGVYSDSLDERLKEQEVIILNGEVEYKSPSQFLKDRINLGVVDDIEHKPKRSEVKKVESKHKPVSNNWSTVANPIRNKGDELLGSLAKLTNTSEIAMVEELHFGKEDKILEIKLRHGSAENEYIVRNGKVYELLKIK